MSVRAKSFRSISVRLIKARFLPSRRKVSPRLGIFESLGMIEIAALVRSPTVSSRVYRQRIGTNIGYTEIYIRVISIYIYVLVLPCLDFHRTISERIYGTFSIFCKMLGTVNSVDKLATRSRFALGTRRDFAYSFLHLLHNTYTGTTIAKVSVLAVSRSHRERDSTSGSRFHLLVTILSNQPEFLVSDVINSDGREKTATFDVSEYPSETRIHGRLTS